MPPLSECAAVDRLAVRFYFRGLTGELEAAVRAHLARCARCRGKLRRFEQVWERGGEAQPAPARARK
ncbi:MAG TPA: zf-HC2 domain-containing protein [Gemmataceae bacterium]|nr:zf-HC2 domain-containing protein [Gemmataceae bacterium]